MRHVATIANAGAGKQRHIRFPTVLDSDLRSIYDMTRNAYLVYIVHSVT
jgi:hypothetical protein